MKSSPSIKVKLRKLNTVITQNNSLFQDSRNNKTITYSSPQHDTKANNTQLSSLEYENLGLNRQATYITEKTGVFNTNANNYG